ncbi:helix-turn-helix transcriptional regulator [Paraburkholderia xenovorans]
MNDSISVRQGVRTVPIVPHIARRHPDLAVRGLHVEYHAIEATAFPERELLQHNLFLYTGSVARAEIKSPEFSGLRWLRPGSLWVMPQGSRHGVRFESAVQGVALGFDQVQLDTLVLSAGGKHSVPIVQSLAACPPKIEHLMRALGHESHQPSGPGHVGLECIATAIILALSQHAGAMTILSETGPRLAPRQIRAIQSYIDERLSQPIALSDLAGAAGLSPFHFLRAFKGSLGVTPGQYLLDCRMERARLLLKNGNLSITEVGIRVGFDDLSHFSRAFRRAVGTAPLMFRKNCRE